MARRPAPQAQPETRPDREQRRSGSAFFRVIAFLFVFLIGFLAGLSYAPLMKQLGPILSAEGPADRGSANGSGDVAAGSIAEPEQQSGDPVGAPLPGTDAADPSSSAGERQPAGDGQTASLSDPSPADRPGMEDGTVAQGIFTGVDTFLTGSGEASIVRTEDGKYALKVSGLSLPDLPDLHVALVATDGVSSDDDVLAADRVALGPIGTTAGDREYVIPDGVDIADYPTAAVWSRPFGILVARANLVQ